MSSLRLAIFDVDGTLADSQAEILSAMRAGFLSEGLEPPDRSAILSIVGLSLPQAMAQLAPALPETRRSALVAAYKQAYFDQRHENGASPLYPGAQELLETLSHDPMLLMGVATGKSRRGLDALIEAHGLDRYFVTRQNADMHPSKPHPAMLEAALAEAGVGASEAVMVGDTSFDMEMARAARTQAIGVTWGYHPPGALALAHRVVESFEALGAAIPTIWSDAT